MEHKEVPNINSTYQHIFFLIVLLHNHDTTILWLNPTSQLLHHLLEKSQSIKGFILTLLSLVHSYPLVTRAPIRTKLLLESSHFLGVHQFPISMKARQINMKSWTPSFLSWELVNYYFKLGKKFIGLICTNVRKKFIKLHPMSSTIVITN
jgi:hypothetical protein